MAPKKSGSSSSHRTGASSSCSGFSILTYYEDDGIYVYLAYYIAYVLFLVLILAVLFSLLCVRRKKTKLTGPIFIAMLLFGLITKILNFTKNTIRFCHGSLRGDDTYYNMSIAQNVFGFINDWLILVVIVYGINAALRQCLTRGLPAIKVASIAICGVMAPITVGYMGLIAYLNWTSTEAGESSTYGWTVSHLEDLYSAETRLGLAYSVLYLASVLASGAMAFFTLAKIRSKNIITGNIMLLVAITIFCAAMYALFGLIPSAGIVALNRDFITNTKANLAMFYLQDSFQILTYVAIICLSRTLAWDSAVEVDAYKSYMQGQQTTQYAPIPQGNAHNTAYVGAGYDLPVAAHH